MKVTLNLKPRNMAATAVLSAALITGAGEQAINTGITFVAGDLNVTIDGDNNYAPLGTAYARGTGGEGTGNDNGGGGQNDGPEGDPGTNGDGRGGCCENSGGNSGDGNDKVNPNYTCRIIGGEGEGKAGTQATARLKTPKGSHDRLITLSRDLPKGYPNFTRLEFTQNEANEIDQSLIARNAAFAKCTEGYVRSPARSVITTPATPSAQQRRTAPAPAALANKNVVMVVADMVAPNAEAQISTSFCDGNDPYAGQSVIGTYSADSWDAFYQGREGVRERRGNSQLDLLTYNTDDKTAFFNGIEGRAIKTPIETRVIYDNDTWDVADVNANAPMADDLPRMSDYEQELVDRELMAALVHLDHLDHEGSNGVYRVYATLGQDILADDAQTVLFAEGSPAYLAEQGGVDLGEVSVNAPMFVNPEDATNARFSDEQKADMAAIQFAEGNIDRAMEIDPDGFVAPQGDCGCAQTAAAEVTSTAENTAYVTSLPAQSNILGGNGRLIAIFAAVVGGLGTAGYGVHAGVSALRSRKKPKGLTHTA